MMQQKEDEKSQQKESETTKWVKWLETMRATDTKMDCDFTPVETDFNHNHIIMTTLESKLVPTQWYKRSMSSRISLVVVQQMIRQSCNLPLTPAKDCSLYKYDWLELCTHSTSFSSCISQDDLSFRSAFLFIEHPHHQPPKNIWKRQKEIHKNWGKTKDPFQSLFDWHRIHLL